MTIGPRSISASTLLSIAFTGIGCALQTENTAPDRAGALTQSLLRNECSTSSCSMASQPVEQTANCPEGSFVAGVAGEVVDDNVRDLFFVNCRIPEPDGTTPYFEGYRHFEGRHERYLDIPEGFIPYYFGASVTDDALSTLVLKSCSWNGTAINWSDCRTDSSSETSDWFGEASIDLSVSADANGEPHPLAVLEHRGLIGVGLGSTGDNVGGIRAAFSDY